MEGEGLCPESSTVACILFNATLSTFPKRSGFGSSLEGSKPIDYRGGRVRASVKNRPNLHRVVNHALIFCGELHPHKILPLLKTKMLGESSEKPIVEIIGEFRSQER